MIHFDAPIQELGRQAIIRFPGDASRELPSRGQVAARVDLEGTIFRTVLEPDGMRGHWLRVPEELQSALLVGEAGPVKVEVEPVKEWPEPDVPEDWGSALDAAPDVAGLWEQITPMARWEWVRWVNATRNPETRQRRVEVGISKLRSGKRRPCCFDLSACTDPELSRSGKLMEVG